MTVAWRPAGWTGFYFQSSTWPPPPPRVVFSVWPPPSGPRPFWPNLPAYWGR